MGHQFMEKTDPSIKLIILLCLGLILPLLSSVYINLLAFLLTLYYFLRKTNIDKEIKINALINIILITIGCLLFYCLYLFNYKHYILLVLFDIDFSFIYYGFKMSLYLSTIYLQIVLYINCINMFELISSLNQILHLPFKLSYFIYNTILFFKEYDNEYELIKNTYKLREIAISKYSLRTFKLIYKHFRRNMQMKNLSIKSKGINYDTVDMYYKAKLGRNEIIYIISYLILFIFKIGLVYYGVIL